MGMQSSQTCGKFPTSAVKLLLHYEHVSVQSNLECSNLSRLHDFLKRDHSTFNMASFVFHTYTGIHTTK